MKRDGELAGAEVGAEVAADLADHVDDQLADLLGHGLKLAVIQALEVLRAVDSVQQLWLLVAGCSLLVVHPCRV